MGKHHHDSDVEATWNRRIHLVTSVVFGSLMLYLAVSFLDVAFTRRSSGPSYRSQLTASLRQLALSARDYHDGSKHLPRGGTFDMFGNGLHGWQTFLLPYVDAGRLYKRVDLELPWHHPKNAPVFQEIVYPYFSPGVEEQKDAASFALSHFAGNVHVFNAGPGLRLPHDFKDGVSNTILMGEAAGNYKPWGHHANWRDAAKGIQSGPDSFGSPTIPDLVMVVMGDCSTRPLSKSVSPEVLKALSTPSGGEKLPDDWDK